MPKRWSAWPKSTPVVDKTGTLTAGKPSLVAIETLPGENESEVLRLAAALERGSEHPLASAILTAAQARSLALPRSQTFLPCPAKGARSGRRPAGPRRQ